MSDQNSESKPEWAPSGADPAFACEVKAGVPQPAGISSRARVRRKSLEAGDYVSGILDGNRTVLARAITLIESNSELHQTTAQEVLAQLMPHTGKAIRIGITGVPGAGKSTLIEAFGLYLLEQGLRVAVLAIDPSSTLSRGSILGDKTRMERLSREPMAFIRPTPSGGTLGGVARKSRESMLLCEAFGFDVILLETVGVGQSEVTVRSMTDFFLLVALAGAGDELQGIKKGIIELADWIVVNKADGENLQRARMAKADLNRVLHFISPATEGWETRAELISALTGEGIPELWGTISNFRKHTGESGVGGLRRQDQTVEWFRSLLDEALRLKFHSRPGMKERIALIEDQLRKGELPPAMAVKDLMDSN